MRFSSSSFFFNSSAIRFSSSSFFFNSSAIRFCSSSFFLCSSAIRFCSSSFFFNSSAIRFSSSFFFFNSSALSFFSISFFFKSSAFSLSSISFLFDSFFKILLGGISLIFSLLLSVGGDNNLPPVSFSSIIIFFIVSDSCEIESFIKKAQINIKKKDIFISNLSRFISIFYHLFNNLSNIFIACNTNFLIINF